jgi:hypothetical protein
MQILACIVSLCYFYTREGRSVLRRDRRWGQGLERGGSAREWILSLTLMA